MVAASGLVEEADSRYAVATASFASGVAAASPLRTSRPAPAHGEHTLEVLRELDYDENEIGALIAGRAAISSR